MKPDLLILIASALMTLLATTGSGAADQAGEDKLISFLGKPKFEMQQIFTGERFPNVVVAADGTVVATWGSQTVRARHIYYSSRKHWFKEAADFCHQRRYAWSYDGGQSWQDAGFHDELPDGPRYRGEESRGSNYNGHFGMMCGLVRLPVEEHDILIYSNADTPGHERVRMTVWASFDGGKSWPVKRLVFDGSSAYSSLAAGRSGTPSEGWIYLQFEGGPDGRYSGAQLARFNLSWITQGQDWRTFLGNSGS